MHNFKNIIFFIHYIHNENLSKLWKANLQLAKSWLSLDIYKSLIYKSLFKVDLKMDGSTWEVPWLNEIFIQIRTTIIIITTTATIIIRLYNCAFEHDMPHIALWVSLHKDTSIEKIVQVNHTSLCWSGWMPMGTIVD